MGLESVRKKLQPAADVTRKFSLVMKNTVDVIRSGFYTPFDPWVGASPRLTFYIFRCLKKRILDWECFK